MNLLGAYDPRMPPNQAKRGTPQQIGPTLWLDEQDGQYADESTWGTIHPRD